MEKLVFAEEAFSYGGEHFHLGYKQAVNGQHYLSLSRLDKRQSERWVTVNIFQQHLPNFIEAFSSVIRAAAFRLERHERSGKLFDPPIAVAGIRGWSPEARPREKLMEQGREAMSDAELLAMLICAGLPGVSAVDLAGQVLAAAGHDLRKLAALNAEDLMRIRGIGHARALSLISAMELALRLAVREQPLHYLKLIHHG